MTCSDRKRSAKDFAEEIKAHLELEGRRSAGARSERGRSSPEGAGGVRQCHRGAGAFQHERPVGRTGKASARHAIRIEGAAAEPGIHNYGDRDAGARGGREHGGLQRHECCSAAVAAGVRSRSRGVSEDLQSAAAEPAPSIPHETFSYAVYDALRQQPGGLSHVIAYVPLSVEQGIGPLWHAAGGSGRRHGERRVLLRPWRQVCPGAAALRMTMSATTQPIAVLSYNYWTRRFARDPHVLGQTLFVNGVAMTIVGVAAEGFEGVEAGGSTDFWIPLAEPSGTECMGQSSRRRESVHRQSDVVVPAADWTRGAGRDQNPGTGTTAAGFSDCGVRGARFAPFGREGSRCSASPMRRTFPAMTKSTASLFAS